MFRSIASTKLEDVLQPKPVGEPVKSHVVAPAPEPKPDFDAMKRMIEGSSGGVVQIEPISQ